MFWSLWSLEEFCQHKKEKKGEIKDVLDGLDQSLNRTTLELILWFCWVQSSLLSSDVVILFCYILGCCLFLFLLLFPSILFLLSFLPLSLLSSLPPFLPSFFPFVHLFFSYFYLFWGSFNSNIFILAWARGMRKKEQCSGWHTLKNWYVSQPGLIPHTFHESVYVKTCHSSFTHTH